MLYVQEDLGIVVMTRPFVKHHGFMQIAGSIKLAADTNHSKL